MAAWRRRMWRSLRAACASTKAARWEDFDDVFAEWEEAQACFRSSTHGRFVRASEARLAQIC